MVLYSLDCDVACNVMGLLSYWPAEQPMHVLGSVDLGLVLAGQHAATSSRLLLCSMQRVASRASLYQSVLLGNSCSVHCADVSVSRSHNH